MSFPLFIFLIPAYLELAAPYAAAGSLLITLFALGYAYSIHRRLRRLTTRRGDALEDTLGELSRRAHEFQKFREELEAYLKVAEERMRTSMRGVGVVRFNPFQGDGSGGNQSFAAAFVDEGGNGVVFSSLHARGHTSTYAKPVEKGSSPFELTAEEREAVRKARENTAVGGTSKK